MKIELVVVVILFILFVFAFTMSKISSNKSVICSIVTTV